MAFGNEDICIITQIDKMGGVQYYTFAAHGIYV